MSQEQELLRADRSCARAVTHLSLCAEDARFQKKAVVLYYLDLKGKFSSTYHRKKERKKEIPYKEGIMEDIVDLVGYTILFPHITNKKF